MTIKYLTPKIAEVMQGGRPVPTVRMAPDPNGEYVSRATLTELLVKHGNALKEIHNAKAQLAELAAPRVKQ